MGFRDNLLVLFRCLTEILENRLLHVIISLTIQDFRSLLLGPIFRPNITVSISSSFLYISFSSYALSSLVGFSRILCCLYSLPHLVCFSTFLPILRPLNDADFPEVFILRAFLFLWWTLGLLLTRVFLGIQG